MKKFLLLLLLILAGYAGYMYVVKGINVFEKYYKKPAVNKEAVKKTEEKNTGDKKVEAKKPEIKKVLPTNHLIIELELNNTVQIKSKDIPTGMVRLASISKDSCVIDFYKRQHILNKRMDFRQVIEKSGTIEVHLIEIKAKSALVSMTNTVNTEDHLFVVK